MENNKFWIDLLNLEIVCEMSNEISFSCLQIKAIFVLDIAAFSLP